MARPSTKEVRRREILRAALDLIAVDDRTEVTVVSVARHMGLTPNAIRYYFRDNDALGQALDAQVMSRFLGERLAAIAELDDPRHQLVRVMELGIPTGPDDIEWRSTFRPLLAGVVTADSGQYLSDVFEDQVAVYRDVLVDGERSGVFALRQPAADIARLLLAMEDYLGLRITLIDPRLDRAEALRLMRDYAALATGTELPSDGRGSTSEEPRG